MEDAFLVCSNKECSLYNKLSEKEKCPKCGEGLKYSNINSFGHANIALCENCNQYHNTLMDFERCSECGSERWFVKKGNLIK